MEDANYLSVGFGRFLEKSLELSDRSLLSIARDLQIDSQKILYWSKRGKSPDQLLALLVKLRELTGETQEQFLTRLEREFLHGGTENETKKNKRTNRD